MALPRPGSRSLLEDPDAELVGRFRAGDEDAFATLAGKYRAVMLSLALGYVPSRAVAEEVVQDAWVGVLAAAGQDPAAEYPGIAAHLAPAGRAVRTSPGCSRP